MPTSRVASQFATVRDPSHMARGPSESNCKLARLELFRSSAVSALEGGDKSLLIISLFNYNMLLDIDNQTSYNLSLSIFISTRCSRAKSRKEETCVSS
jgi:hypothetical protein